MTYIEPLLALFLGIAVVGLLRWRSSGGRALASAAVIGLFLLCWPPADWVLSRPLEIWYHREPYPSRQTPEPIHAIVVFGSTVERPLAERPYPRPDEQTYQRAEFAAWLYAHWAPVPVLACGGQPEPGQKPVSAIIRMLLHNAGVPEEKIWTEDRSRNTHENAIFGAEILRRYGIRVVALVVDASSMMRAERCLRKTGIGVVPTPSEFRDFGRPQDELLPNWHAIRRNERTLHEVAGLAWYALHGWI